ncbi:MULTISPECIES: TadE/TadG family type IV pilus assembly protein [unclassified Pseudomonas]|uniref:TadE/TadG family type IV pilus assembly protein n=1 Tax=unclassified Pseudomonas TaxID=196821 RepID=UPI0028D4D208|nr:TadE/TadG family type IV pilus assembly protein [uncultured Pseudomonas sp.]
MKIGLPRKQQGAAAIEFALVFVIFFAVLYGVVSYSLPLLLLQSFNNSTAEAVRRSVAVDPTLAAGAYKTTVENTAKAVLKDKLSWVPGGLTVTQTAIYDPTAGVLTVTASLPATALRTILPVIVLPGNIRVPNLPDKLESVSSMKF